MWTRRAVSGSPTRTASAEVLERLPFVPLAGASDGKILNHAKLLAEMIPPRSNPAGGRELKTLAKENKQDMQDFVDENSWPKRRPGKKMSAKKQRWLHTDYISAPPFLTKQLYELFDKVIAPSKGEPK